MHLLRCILLLLLIISVCSSLKLKGQSPYSSHLEILTKLSPLAQEKNYSDALVIINDNKELFEFDELTQFWFDWYKGILLFDNKQYKEAMPYLTNALSFMEEYLDEISNNDIKYFLAIYYYAPDCKFKLDEDKDSLIEGLQYAKSIYEKMGNESDPIYQYIVNDLKFFEEDIVALWDNILNEFRLGEYQNVIPKILKTVEYLRNYREQDVETLIMMLRLLAVSYYELGDYNNSEKIFLEAMEIADKNENIKEDPVYRLLLNSFSCLYILLNNYEKAAAINTYAKILYETEQDFGENYVFCLSNGAVIQTSMGYKTLAKMHIDVALQQFESNLEDKKLIELYDDFGRLKAQPTEVLSSDENYYIINKVIPFIKILCSAFSIYYDMGYVSDAIKNAKKSVELASKYNIKDPLPYNNLGVLYLSKSRFNKAAELLSKAYELCKTPYEFNEIGMNYAFSLFLDKDPNTPKFSSELSAKIRANIQDMFAFLSQEERANYFRSIENYIPLLNLFMYSSGNENYFSTIYDNILETKGLLLRSTNRIRDALIFSKNDNDKKNYERLLILKQELINETNDSIRAGYYKEINEIDKHLTRNVNSYAQFKSSQNITWKDIRDKIGDKEISIEFYNIPVLWDLNSIQNAEGESRYCALVVKKGYANPHIIPLCRESELKNVDKDEYYVSQSLYNLIWKPLEEELKGIDKIYFSADRELHRIGIEYVPMPDKGTVDDRYEIVRLSSTRLLAEPQKERKTDKAVLFGGLRYEMNTDSLIAESRASGYRAGFAMRSMVDGDQRYGVEYLPGTLDEVIEISKNFATPPVILTGTKGTEESFKSLARSEVDILHLATHGFFWTPEHVKKHDYVSFLKNIHNLSESNEDFALIRSGLMFSGANIGLKRNGTLPDDIEDGVLTALELSNMNLGNVDLVVMSACESGLGETSGEGVFGLQRGFKLAGANALLMSLWKVDDAATKILMTEFYRNYLSGKSKHESLKLARQTLRQDTRYSDPHFWAAFILLDALN